jgi:hypothetical protein
MSQPDLASLATRLDALEYAFSKSVFVKPSPVDPPPDDFVNWKGTFMRDRLAQLVQFNPSWFSDPPPDDFLNVRVLDLIRRFRGGFTDPAPDDLAHIKLKDLLQRIPGGGFTDPSPEEITKLTTIELETHIHKLGAEIVRLKSLERLMQDRLGQVQKHAK